MAVQDKLGAEELKQYYNSSDEIRLSPGWVGREHGKAPELEPFMWRWSDVEPLVLKSGEIWIFRHDGTAKLTLEPSVYLEKARIKPRATKQVVLSSRAIRYATRVRWTLAKAQDTPSHLRDLERDDSEILEQT